MLRVGGREDQSLSGGSLVVRFKVRRTSNSANLAPEWDLALSAGPFSARRDGRKNPTPQQRTGILLPG
jgi:hypothetical protein